MRLVVQAEQETLRVYDRGSALSACSLLDTDAVTAGHWLTSDSQRSAGRRSCDEMLRDVVDKFSRLRVSRTSLLTSINQSINRICRIGAISLTSRIGGATVCRLRCVSTVEKKCFKIRSKSSQSNSVAS